MRGDLWASMRGQRSFRFETAALPAIRFQAAGERTLVLFSTLDLRAWKDAQEQMKPEEDREKITFGRLQNFLVRMQEISYCFFISSTPSPCSAWRRGLSGKGLRTPPTALDAK